jgi:hypothetical protein
MSRIVTGPYNTSIWYYTASHGPAVQGGKRTLQLQHDKQPVVARSNICPTCDALQGVYVLQDALVVALVHRLYVTSDGSSHDGGQPLDGLRLLQAWQRRHRQTQSS